jgi:hypothetical protein
MELRCQKGVGAQREPGEPDLRSSDGGGTAAELDQCSLGKESSNAEEVREVGNDEQKSTLFAIGNGKNCGAGSTVRERGARSHEMIEAMAVVIPSGFFVSIKWHSAHKRELLRLASFQKLSFFKDSSATVSTVSFGSSENVQIEKFHNCTKIIQISNP